MSSKKNKNIALFLSFENSDLLKSSVFFFFPSPMQMHGFSSLFLPLFPLCRARDTDLYSSASLVWQIASLLLTTASHAHMTPNLINYNYFMFYLLNFPIYLSPSSIWSTQILNYNCVCYQKIFSLSWWVSLLKIFLQVSIKEKISCPK